MASGENVVAIDGPAASGKSTVAALAAERLGVAYVNTGNMYRAVTLAALRRFGDDSFQADSAVEILDDINLEYADTGNGVVALRLNGEDVGAAIRSPEVAARVSEVAAVPEVRQWLVKRQRAFADKGMIVMEGRDIGTVVFPGAKYKFFLTASPEVRARRRLAQAGECRDGATVASVAKEIAERDKRDMERPVSPLKKADDAVLVDTSGMTVDGVVDFIVEKVTGAKCER